MAAVAMFPLGSVLFPHTPLPLRIFERRYLVMLGRLLEESSPEFGVVLIERGFEAGGGDERFDIATMARIVHVVPGADDIQLVAVGDRRVVVEEWLEEDPHPAARVRELPPLTWDDALAPLRDQAEQTVRRALARGAGHDNARWRPDVELSEENVAACWQIAAIAPLGEMDQLELLRATSTAQLLARVMDLTLAAEPGLGPWLGEPPREA